MSELIREALRRYERSAWWDEVNSYGRTKAAEKGISEGNVDLLVHASRGARKKFRTR